jgi:hypothetical protein
LDVKFLVDVVVVDLLPVLLPFEKEEGHRTCLASYQRPAMLEQIEIHLANEEEETENANTDLNLLHLVLLENQASDMVINHILLPCI